MKYGRIFNFSAGPAVMPEPVLETLRDEMLNYKGTGMSVMEMSHRSKPYDAIIAHAEQKVRDLLKVPATHSVLFLQGGATHQFAMAPYNFYTDGHPIDFIHTGAWTEKAIKEAKRVAKCNVVATSEDKNFTYIPDYSHAKFNPDACYVHICTNNTIFGTKYNNGFPNTGKVPMIADMSSEILSRPIDVSKFHLIYAGAQKNLGPSGVCLAIINKDWAENTARKDIAEFWSYRAHIKEGSRLNTPAAFGIYAVGQVLDWVEKQGGPEKLQKLNQEKAAILYNAIDSSGGFYDCPVQKEWRSDMNIVWRVKKDEALEDKFVKEAQAKGLDGLKGHRSVGGIRASIYNAFPIEGVKALVDFMKEFQKKNG
ncbi:MAG TPA: 3-phosphoserine/phosphohydroxythreonine transaminase [Bdellovibrionota bacterium]|nr:3-phosphoserine/phosphohydroxythreonine transaminase [Bdellovibrionota bacterium]